MRLSAVYDAQVVKSKSQNENYDKKNPDIYKGIFQRNYHQQLVKQKL